MVRDLMIAWIWLAEIRARLVEPATVGELLNLASGGLPLKQVLLLVTQAGAAP